MFLFVRKVAHSLPDEFLLLSADLLSSCCLKGLQIPSVKDRLLFTDIFQKLQFIQ